jgi:hypothetical protein
MKYALLLSLLLASPCLAQGSLSRVFPNGGQRGTTVDVAFEGKDVPESATLMVEGAGVRGVGPFVKGVGKIEIAADAEPGARQVRLAGAKGVTSPRPFAVGTLPELPEKEPNNTAAQSQRLEKLPVTINGTLVTRPDLDLFTISMKQGECLVVAGESRSLGAATNLLVRIRDPKGQEVMSQVDYRTRDPLLGFTAPGDGDYTVELSDVLNNYSNIDNSYVYRVTFTKGAWIDSVFPPGAQRGVTTRVAFTGWNLDGKPGPGRLDADIAVPQDAAARYPISAGGAGNRVLLQTSDIPGVAEVEPPAGVTAAPQVLSLPVTVSGTFGARGDVDTYQFTAKAGDRLRLDVDARELGSFADALLAVRDAAGKLLTTADDAEGTRDPRLLWTAPAEGIYKVVLRDVASGSRGGPEYFYRLTIAPPAPELRATTADPTLLLKPGQKLEVTVKVNVSELSEPVVISAEGLPVGVTAPPVTTGEARRRSGGSEAKLVFTAAAGAAPGCTPLRLLAKSGNLTVPVRATWVLSSDRSGTLAEGSTEQLALLIPAP